MIYSLELPLPPSVNRMYRRERRGVRLSDEARAWKQEAYLLALAVFPEPLDGPVCAVWEFYMPDERSDASNRIKVLEDALQGAAYHNDRQIVEGTYRKFIDRARPRVEAVIWRKGDEE